MIGGGFGGALTKEGFGRGGIAGGIAAGIGPLSDAIRFNGSVLGISKPRNFRLINLQAMENSLMSILPSASVSAKALK